MKIKAFREDIVKMTGWLIIEEGAELGGVYHLTQQVLTIGRGPANPVQIVGSSISRRHAQIKRVANQFLITDLGSRNGTIVNQSQISEPTLLANGDVVQIGDVVLLFLQDKGPEHQPDLVKKWKKSSTTTRLTRTEVMKARDIIDESDTTEEFDPRKLSR
jgi:pSer/pThr/pTyr-binding forkhead associated (FHA) protein